MRVAFLQTHPEYHRVEKNVSRLCSMIASTDADLIVAPELCTTGYLFADRAELAKYAEEIPHGETCERVREVARRDGTVVVFGMVEKSGDKLFNSAVLFSGDSYHVYRKIHLFGPESGYFDPGDLKPTCFDYGSVKIGMMICFDYFFPELCRIIALQGAHVICHPSNLVTQYCQEIMKTRSLENRIFAITTNRIGSETLGNIDLEFTGRSQITAPDGKVMCGAGEKSEVVQIVDIDPAAADDKKVTPWNDLFENRRPEFYEDLLRS